MTVSNKKEVSKVNILEAQLYRKDTISKFLSILPKNVPFERVRRIALTAFRNSPELQECSISSVLGSLMKCAELGLEPASSLGNAYLVPFKSKKTGTLECQVIIGYKGFIHLAIKSGKVKNIYARSVYASDEFLYEYGLNEKLIHKPGLIESTNADITHVYAIAVLTDGSKQFEVMSYKDIEEVKSKSKAQNIWKNYFSEMAKKTVIRRLCKYLPLSYELETATGLDELGDVGKQQFTYDAEPVEQQPDATPEEEILKYIEATN